MGFFLIYPIKGIVHPEAVLVTFFAKESGSCFAKGMLYPRILQILQLKHHKMKLLD